MMMERPIYRIKDWHVHFEKAQARKCVNMVWVAFPNRHDGNGYRRVVAHERRAELLAAWMLLVQVASKCEPRGVLVNNGQPMDAEDLHFKTGLDTEAFELAFDVLIDPRIDWLEQVTPDAQDIPL